MLKEEEEANAPAPQESKEEKSQKKSLVDSLNRKIKDLEGNLDTIKQSEKEL